MKSDTKVAIFTAFTIIGGVAVAMLVFFYGRYVLYGLGVILAMLLIKFVIVPLHDSRAQTALPRAEAKKVRAEAKRIHRETCILSELHDHNMEYAPSVFFHKSDANGNYALPIGRDGRLITHLLPGNSATGNNGIPAKMVLDYLQQQNTVEADYYEDEEEQQQITRPKILLSQQIERGLTAFDEEESVFGYPIDTYEPFRAVLFEREGNFVNSLFVVGMQNQGKSTIGTYFAALTVNHGGYLLVIDPDAEVSEQSLSSRLGPLKNFLLCEVADTPEKAKHLLEIAENEIDHPSDFPLLLLVDEFSLIMRHGKAGGKWQEVAALCASTVENYATRGRKRLRRAVVFGQISNATRTGGTELRDSCAQIVFQTPYKKAVLVLQDADDDEIAELAPSLTPGMAIVLQKSDTYIMQFPFPDERGLQIIASVRAESDALTNAGPRLRVLPRPDAGSEWDMRPDAEPTHDERDVRTSLPQNTDFDRFTDEYHLEGCAHETNVLPPLDGAHTSHNERTADYPVLDSLQVELFATAYALSGNMDESLKRVGANSRYREHARRIISERKLRNA